MSNLNSRFSFDIDSQDNAKIKVVGVGGGGGNAVNKLSWCTFFLFIITGTAHSKSDQ